MNVENAINIDWIPLPSEATFVKLVVMNGVVMGSTYCVYSGYIQNLTKLKRDVFYVHYKLLHGNLCHMCDCNNLKVPLTQICTQHQNC